MFEAGLVLRCATHPGASDRNSTAALRAGHCSSSDTSSRCTKMDGTPLLLHLEDGFSVGPARRLLQSHRVFGVGTGVFLLGFFL